MLDDRYEEGFKDGFLRAWEYVIQNANVHSYQFQKLWEALKNKELEK